MSKLTEHFKTKVHQKITEIEKATSLEIVPVVIERASDYFAWRLALCFSSAFFALILQSFFFGWGITYQHFFISIGIAILLWLILDRSSVLKFFLAPRIFREAVEEEAAVWFLKEEIFNTRDRTGIMIFISEFEKCVLVLADKGLLAKVPESHFSLLGQSLASDFQRGEAGETFMKGLDALAKEVAPLFPPHSSNSNELKNEVRTSTSGDLSSSRE